MIGRRYYLNFRQIDFTTDYCTIEPLFEAILAPQYPIFQLITTYQTSTKYRIR